MSNLTVEFSLVLKNEEKILDELTVEQKKMRKVLSEKNWECLTELMTSINSLSDSFQAFDSRRDEVQEQLKLEEIKPFYPQLQVLRSKLLKCKVENKIISNYVNVTRDFISQVIDKALPKTGNKNYTKKGLMTAPQPKSVLVDVRG